MAKKSNKKFQKRSKSNRTFSESFKRSKVKDLIEKRIRVRDLCELYEVSRTSVYKWIYLYSDTSKEVKTVVQMESEAQKTKVLLQRLAEYERVIGQKQMTIDLLEKGFELASEDLDYDVKKKYVPRPWNGSEDTPINTITK
mgnify:CR=1 FL=1